MLASSLDIEDGAEPRRPPNQDALVAPLSDREVEVLCELAAGLSYTEIGRSLYVTRNTIKSHVQHVYTKLGVTSRDEAIDHSKRRGIC